MREALAMSETAQRRPHPPAQQLQFTASLTAIVVIGSAALGLELSNNTKFVMVGSILSI